MSRLTLRIMQLRVYEAFLATTCQYTQKWCAILKYKWEIVRVVVRAPVVQKVDSAIHWLNHYPLDSTISFPNTYSMDSDLSTLYPMDSAIHLLNNRGLMETPGGPPHVERNNSWHLRWSLTGDPTVFRREPKVL